MDTGFIPGSVQICPLNPMEHSQVSLAMQAPLTHDGLQITRNGYISRLFCIAIEIQTWFTGLHYFLIIYTSIQS